MNQAKFTPEQALEIFIKTLNEFLPGEYGGPYETDGLDPDERPEVKRFAETLARRFGAEVEG